MQIGILSDTHNHLDPSVFTYFDTCDEIWHAGDIGNLELLEKLDAFKPTVAVYGNVDDHKIRASAPENQIFERNGLKILMTHIAGKPPGYNTRVKKLIRQVKPHLLICGHSHILRVERDHTHRLLYVNPGAAGIHGFHKVKTLLRMKIQEGKAQDLEVIELGPRARLKN